MIASDTTGYTTSNVVNAAVTAIIAPAAQFSELFPSFIPIKVRIVLFLVTILD